MALKRKTKHQIKMTVLELTVFQLYVYLFQHEFSQFVSRQINVAY